MNTPHPKTQDAAKPGHLMRCVEFSSPHQRGLSKIPLTCVVDVCPLSMGLFVSRWYKHTSEGCMFRKADMKGVPQANVLRKDFHKSYLQRADPVWNQ